MNLQQIYLNLIDADDSFNCRPPFMFHHVEELAKSLELHKQLTPAIVVRNGNRFDLIAGFRRLKAKKFLKHETIWCIVSDMDLATARVINLIENLQRKQLTMMDEAIALKTAFPELVEHDIAKQVGQSIQWVLSRVRLLGMPEAVQKAAHTGRLSEGQLRTLQTLTTQQGQLKRLNRMISDNYVEKPTNVQSQHAIQKMLVELCERGVTGLPLKLIRWTMKRCKREEVFDARP